MWYSRLRLADHLLQSTAVLPAHIDVFVVPLPRLQPAQNTQRTAHPGPRVPDVRRRLHHLWLLFVLLEGERLPESTRHQLGSCVHVHLPHLRPRSDNVSAGLAMLCAHALHRATSLNSRDGGEKARVRWPA